MKSRSKSRKQTRPFDLRAFFAGPRKWFVLVPAIVLLIGAGWWGYRSFTVLPPPDFKQADPRQLADYLGDSRGLVRLSVDQRERYLADSWQYYSKASPEQQRALVRALNSMTPAQQRTFSNATAGIAKKHVLEHAERYNRLRSEAERARYVDNFIKDFNNLRRELSGNGTIAPGMEVLNPLNAAAPKKPEDVQAAIVNNTSPGERAKAEPFINDVVKRNQTKIAEARNAR